MSEINHCTICFFKLIRLVYENSIGLLPQPKLLAKSFPVPIGITPNIMLVNLIPLLAISWITHNTVPSPPQMITLF